ncbi:MAG: lipoyl synthase [Deltaproteobacteria bacterium]|nr:lipoyl synthase [Deltaproteobacteria bacterium]
MPKDPSQAPATAERKPPWLKVRAPGGERYAKIKGLLRTYDLHTVCEEARCPNVGECWAEGTATVMILGDVCTRGCSFCAVATGNPQGALDPREPEHTARALAALELDYVVLTMVDRDDLLDGGAAHVAATVRALRRRRPETLVETLVGDFQGRLEDVATVVLRGAPDVFSHNLETVERLQRTVRDARCSQARTLAVLAHAKALAPARYTKSSLMVGLGETEAELLAAMRALRESGVDVLTLGQYLRPTARHHPVARYASPEEFAAWAREGYGMGFKHVASGPLVRSSYRASEAFLSRALKAQGGVVEGARRRLPVVP